MPLSQFDWDTCGHPSPYEHPEECRALLRGPHHFHRRKRDKDELSAGMKDMIAAQEEQRLLVRFSMMCQGVDLVEMDKRDAERRRRPYEDD